MDNWEFLLQKKGDKSWLPLESPTVEILEGQYRLAARSELANAMIGIQIVYQPSSESSHHPNQQRISKRVSPDGLLIVMPYTHFAPGAWQVSCQMVEPQPAPKQSANLKASVKFDVQAVSPELASEWQYPDLVVVETNTARTAPDRFDSTNFDATDFDFDATDTDRVLGIADTEPVVSPSSSLPSATPRSAATPTPTAYASPMMQMAEQMSEQLVQSLLDEFSPFDDDDFVDELGDSAIDLGSENPAPVDEPVRAPAISSPVQPQSEESSASPDSSLPQVLLNLSQAQYLVSAQSNITIAGEAYTAGELEITLKNPENLEILVNVCHFVPQEATDSLSSNVFPFEHIVNIPHQSRPQVLIGEIRLYPTDDSLQDEQTYQLSQAITVTYQSPTLLADVAREMEAIANSMAETSATIVTSSKAKPASKASAKNTPALELPPISPISSPTKKSAPSAPSKPSQPATASKSPSLPNLPPPIQPALTENLQPEIASVQPQEEVNPPQNYDEFNELFESELLDSDVKYPPSSQSAQISDADEPDLLYLFEEDLPSNYEQMLEESPSSEQPSLLGALNIGDRFLSKLQNLSLDAIAEKAEDDAVSSDPVESEPVKPEEISPTTPTDPPIVSSPPAPTDAIADLDRELEQLLSSSESGSPQAERLWQDPNEQLSEALNQEYNEALRQRQTALSPDLANPNYGQGTGQIYDDGRGATQNPASAPAPAQNLPTLAPQEPIPLPIVEIPLGNLVAGTPIPARIKLPAIAPQLFVKFWIKDCQTRATIDGPRWLVDFKPETESEFVETTMQISIPLGSMEVALEAVTIEVQTQRESHKTRITRSVMPPNLDRGNDLDFEIAL
ncbi:hypothetical protein V2H45_01730 [Tumidithrix elongata RA019]|uniref:Uncharacterized protein n=1 Tax=Tumidithrix elongata BACA0141 TaxID=2716417 RepID=A0AAW9PQ59_9CYAN|nr:hypothetical protein [Tumidithrix elongata RA019]